MLRATIFGIGVLFSVLVPAVAAAGPIGAQLLIQQWDPRDPQRQDIRVPYDQGSAVSDAVNGGWAKVRAFACGPLKKTLGSGDILAKGITLYNIECRLPDGELTATQDGPRGLKLVYRVRDVHFAATSTTADFPCGKGCDPRFSLRFDVAFVLRLALQSAGDAVRVNAAEFEVSNALIDSHNWSADIAKWFVDNLVPLLTGPSFRTLAQNALDSVRFDFANAINPNLASLNSVLRTPSGLVRIGLWARPGKIYVAFAPAEWLPPANGSVGGQVIWKSAGASNQPVSNCGVFQMQAIVQTGPAPLTDPITRSLGFVPTRTVGRVVSGSPLVSVGNAWQCQYSLGGLPAGIPVQVLAHTPSAAAGGARNSRGMVALRLVPVGWDANGRTVVDGGIGRDWEVQGHYVAPPGMAERQRVLKKDMLPDPAPDRTRLVPSTGVIRAPAQAAPAPAGQVRALARPMIVPQDVNEKTLIK